MLIATIEDAAIRRRVIKRLAKARESSTSEGIFPKLVDASGGSPIFGDSAATAPAVGTRPISPTPLMP